MKLLNYTGHKITYCDFKGKPIHTYEPIGEVRISTIKEKVDEIDTIPIFKLKETILKNLPPSQRGSYYVVSIIAAKAMKQMGRQDMLVLGKKIDLKEPDNAGFQSLNKV